MLVNDVYRPHCLKPQAWPKACFLAWEEAQRPADLFDAPKPAAKWRAITVKKVCKGFGVYLHWLQWRGLLLNDSEPDCLVCVVRARDFQDALVKAGCAPLTVFNRIQELHLMMGVLAPNRYWSWLAHAAKLLRHRAHTVRHKRGRLQHVTKLENLGIDLMAKADTDARLTMFKRALMFRDGLMIALLSHRPLRLKNFAGLRLETSLLVSGDTASIVFSPREMKNKRPLEIPFPDTLIEALQIYLAKYRPWLLARPHVESTGVCDSLWISNEAHSMADVSISNMIKHRTFQAFGVDLCPHLFRDCAVTSMVRDAPESARLTRDILGHATLDMTNKHYNQALMIEASRRHTKLIESLFKDSARNHL